MGETHEALGGSQDSEATLPPAGENGLIAREQIDEAAARIADWIRLTPILEVDGTDFRLRGRVCLKLELMQRAGSFKARGAFNRILSADVPPAGVIAASGGNHGAAVAYAAKALGVPAEVYLPEPTSLLKIDRIRALGARVVTVSGLYADALDASLDRADATGALVVHAFDQPEVVAGQGTLGRELDQQLPDLDTVLVGVGGGGLIGGIAAWFRGEAEVVAVEPRGAPTLAAALAAGGTVEVDVDPAGVSVEATGARRLGETPFRAISRYVTTSLLVEDEAIINARRLLWDQARVAAEPGGVVALAALLSGAYVPRPDERVAVVISGGNADPRSL